jgi:hypothetical protein
MFIGRPASKALKRAWLRGNYRGYSLRRSFSAMLIFAIKPKTLYSRKFSSTKKSATGESGCQETYLIRTPKSNGIIA